MRSSESTAAVSKALVTAMVTLSNPKATGKATIEKKQGGSFSYRFAQLHEIVDDVRASLALHDLAVMQEALTDDHGRIGVVTRIVHTSGEWLEMGPLWLPGGGSAQEHGSAVTYARRYSLTTALLLAADEDDDGSKASGSRARRGSEGPRSSDPGTTSASEGHPGQKTGTRADAETAGGTGDEPGEGPTPPPVTSWDELVALTGSTKAAATALNKANRTSYSQISGKTAAPEHVEAALAAVREA